jgi:hypothetical protein
MKTKLILFSAWFIFLLALFSCKTERKTATGQITDVSGIKQEWAIVIHGGAGGMTRESLTPELDKEYRASL